jgi:thioredoxin-like negative regulator of GroEL
VSEDHHPPVIISRRIARLERSETETAEYRVAENGLPSFGDEESILRSFYEKALRGYRHGLVKLESEEGRALGLVPPSWNAGPAYVEIDDWALPILASEDGLAAVQVTESLIRGDVQPTKELLSKIAVLMGKEDLPFKMALFKRLFFYFVDSPEMLATLVGSQQLRSDLAEVFKLLPWAERFYPYLLNLAHLLGQLRHLVAKPLPELSYYFGYVHPRLSSSLSAVVEALKIYKAEPTADNFSTLLVHSSKFTSLLRRIPGNWFPGKIRLSLMARLGGLGDYLEVEAGRIKTLDSTQLRNLHVTLLRVALFCLELRRVSGLLTTASLVSNVSRAGRAADGGDFFDEKPWYLERLPEELHQAAIQLADMDPKQALEVIQKQESWSDSKLERERVNMLLNCAEVLKFHAQNLDRNDGPKYREDASRFVQKSLPFYWEAMKLGLGRKGLVSNRHARALTLQGKIAASLGNYSLAHKSLTDAVEVLKPLTREDYLGEPEKGLYAKTIIQIEAKLLIARHFAEEREQVQLEIVRALEQLITENPEHAKAYGLLCQYYVEVADFTTALKLLDDWINQWRDMGKPKPSLDSLQYRAAQLSAIAASEDESFKLEAITRYADVLKDQPANSKAADELIEMLYEFPSYQFHSAYALVDAKLARVGPECQPLHAVVRVLLEDDISLPTDVRSWSEAFAALMKGSTPLIEKANDYILQLSHGGGQPTVTRKQLLTALEIMSKWYFKRSNRIPAAGELDAAERVTNLYLQIDKKDVVCWTRKFDIAMQRGNVKEAESVVNSLVQEFPTDPILQLKLATLRLRQGDLLEAEKILTDTARAEAEPLKPWQSHPAVVDRLAFVTLRLNKPEAAQRLYEEILHMNPYDPVARFGLGRVYFERGLEYWRMAFDEWLRALRVRSKGKTECDRAFAKATAHAIASLCSQRPTNGQPRGRKIGREVLSKLEETIHTESATVSSMLIDSLAALGVMDEDVVTTAYEASKDAKDVFLARRVAQYVRARTIYGILKVDTRGLKDSEVATYVEWCEKRGILPEYLAGAKGSYGRALLRLALSGEKISASLAPEQTLAFEDSLSSSLRKLYEHIRSTEYSAGYYRLAYELFNELKSDRAIDWAWFSEGLLRGIALKMWNGNQQLESFFGSFLPAISLWALRDILHIQDGHLSIGGWVDIDALKALEKRDGHNGWQVVGSDLRREFRDFVDSRTAQTYANFGIFFKQEPDSGQERRIYCCISALLEPDMLELEAREETQVLTVRS